MERTSFPPIEIIRLILSYISSKSWKLCSFHVHTTWFPCEDHLVYMWIPWFPCGFHMGTMWVLCGHNMVIMWTPCGFQVDTMWFPCGHHMVSMFLCGHHHFQPLQMRSKSMETRSRLDLLLDYPHNRYLFRWFKFTLKPPYTVAHGNFLLAIWDTSHWTSFVKFGLKTAYDIS